MAEAEIKVAFVSNLTGTTLTEVSLGSFLAPLCLLSRGLFLLAFHLNKGVLPLSSSAHLLLDFTLLITPLVLSCTVLSDILHWVIIAVAVADACAVSLMCSSRKSKTASSQSLLVSFERSHVESKLVPFLTAFRVLVNIKTAISILAVDFAVFPRRYAKTETYGTGVMDFGVGAYVIANAMVCPEARGKKVQGSKLRHLAKQLFSVWPLVVLGFARLASVKSTGYHEHVTEYGLHWNFFFTLAIVRVVASAILAAFPVNVSWLLSLLISGVYQVVLETTELKSFLIQNPERGVSGFMQANKEGIFSVVGYVAVYMAGVQVGVYLMHPRTLVKDWIRVIRNLLLGSFGLWVALHVCQMHLEPVSRRMANLPFCIWTLAQSLFFLSCLGIADLALLFAKVVSSSSAAPASWNPHRRSETERKISNKLDALCLVQSVSRNQLLFFLLANLMTGLTNMLIDTLKSNDFFAVCVLLSYMFINSFIIFMLHVNNVTIKFW